MFFDRYHFYDEYLQNGTMSYESLIMQQTRRQILDILKHKQESTVDEIVLALREMRGDKITAVTVRHHLGVLQDEGLINTAKPLHRSTPGRPQHVYLLTSKGLAYFPTNYQRVATGFINQMKQNLPDSTINVIIEGVASELSSEVYIPEDATMSERLNLVVKHLNSYGYEAGWEYSEEGYILYTDNCPYHHASQHDDTFCEMDMRLVSKMLGRVPRLMKRVAKGDERCSYLVPFEK